MKTFRFEGGPKDQTTERLEESTFPLPHDDGEYTWSGTSHGIGVGGENGDELPDADVATAVWHEKLTPSDEYREKSLILNEKRSPGPDGKRAPKDEVREAFFDRQDALKQLQEDRDGSQKDD